MISVLFRADDGPGTGAGHLMRCRSLADAVLAQDGRVVLLARTGSSLHDAWSTVGARIETHGHDVGSREDLHATLQFAKNMAVDWVVVDGYAFDAAWLESVSSHQRLLYLDDLGERDAHSLLVLNQNMGAEERYMGCYRRPMRALLGVEWLLLGRDWQSASAVPEAHRILVTLGGDDRDNIALAIMHELVADGRNFHADVVCSAPAPGYVATQMFANSHPGRFTLHRAPVDLVPLMCRASIAVCAGGVTPLEATSVGVPIIIKATASNQIPGSRALAAAGVAKMVAEEGVAGVGRLALDLLDDADGREAMSRRARALLDRAGAARVVAVMKETMQ